MGRPTKYQTEVGLQICESIVLGKGVRAVCEETGISVSTLFRWLESNKNFREQYARAKEVQAEILADELKSIADETPTCEIPTKHGDVFTSIDKAGIERNKLRVDTRKWIASKLLPKKYGDKVQQEHTGPNGGPVVFTLQRIGSK